jgi:hypothetical protein
VAASVPHSTIVRAFQVLEGVSPGTGARWGARLWFTAPPPIPLHRLAQAPPGVETGVELDGRTLHATAWGSGPLVLLLHGWGGRSEQLAAFVGPLTAAGHRVIALDAPGHGRSGPGALGGRRSTVPEFSAALRAAAAQDGGRVHAVVAHSFGAAAAALAVREGCGRGGWCCWRRWATRAGCSRASPRSWGWAPGCGRAWSGASCAPSGCPGRRSTCPPRRGPSPSHRRWWCTTGTTVRSRSTRAAASPRTGPDARLIATDRLGHRRLLRDPGVVDAVARFVAASGAASPETGRWSA